MHLKKKKKKDRKLCYLSWNLLTFLADSKTWDVLFPAISIVPPPEGSITHRSNVLFLVATRGT